jgi:hypothetical protein
MNQVPATEMVLLRRSAGIFTIEKADTKVEENYNYIHYK